MGKILDGENQLALTTECKNNTLEDTHHRTDQDKIFCINILRHFCLLQRCSTLFEMNAVSALFLKWKMPIEYELMGKL